ncbi:MAG TPA: hypothetical protein PLD82_01020 [Spirochaetota bacterium]|nr:hypothetical protein [Spirochaetota bacterium]
MKIDKSMHQPESDCHVQRFVRGDGQALPRISRWRERAGFVFRKILARKIVLRILLLFCSARIIPRRYLVRYFRSPGVLVEVEDVLGKVRSIGGWSRAWANLAAGRVALARDACQSGWYETACGHELAAALYYHGASSTLCTSGEIRLRNMERADTAMTRAMQLVHERSAGVSLGIGDALLVRIPWKGTSFNGWLLLPPRSVRDGLRTTVVIPGGADSGKEEYLQYARHFLVRGFAVLVMNDPGVGETARMLPLEPDGGALYDAVRESLVRAASRYVTGESFWLGASLGGWKVLQVGVHRGRADGLLGIVSISGPYCPARYYGRLVFAIHEMVRFALGVRSSGRIRAVLRLYSLETTIGAISVPSLVVVGGRERIIPASDGIRLYTDIGGSDVAMYYLPGSDHVCMDGVDLVLPDIADWMYARCPRRMIQEEGS